MMIKTGYGKTIGAIPATDIQNIKPPPELPGSLLAVRDDHPETLPAPWEKVVVSVLEVRFLKFKDADRVAHAYFSLKARRRLNRGSIVSRPERIVIRSHHDPPLRKKGSCEFLAKPSNGEPFRFYSETGRPPPQRVNHLDRREEREGFVPDPRKERVDRLFIYHVPFSLSTQQSILWNILVSTLPLC